MIPAFFLHRVEAMRGQVAKDILVVFLASDHFDDNSFSTVVFSDVKENLEPDGVVLLVRDSVYDAVLGRFATSAVLAQLYKLRLKERVPVTIVSFDSHGAEKRRTAYPAGADTSDLAFSELRRTLVTTVFRARRGFVESSPSYHFENPSGKHTERFIRLSNILHSSAEVSFLAFCALPFIPADAKVIYVDTPALFALTSAVNDHLRSLSLGRPSLFVESFGSYQGLKDFRFDEPFESIVIVSASSSGSLADVLVREHGFERRQLVHFLYLGPVDDKLRIVADLSFDKTHNPFGYDQLPSKQEGTTCSLCSGGSVAIPLRGDQFEPAGPQSDPIYLTRPDAPEGLRSLIGAMAGLKIFGVGLGSKNQGQPRLYDVCAANLGKSDRFGADLEYVVRRSVPSGAEFIIYLDEGSEEIARQVEARIAATGKPASVLARGQLDSVPVGTETPVVLVAAVIESGRSLLDLSRDLRTITPQAPLTYIVGFDKTSGEDRRESLSRNLTQTHAPAPHQTISVEKLILPASQEDHAWGREIDVLRDILDHLPEDHCCRPMWSGRLQRLSDRTNILYDDLFLPTPAGEGLSIRPGFVFAAPDGKCTHFSQADVFFIISSILQRLRANSEKPGARALRSNWFQQTVLAPETFSRFNDGIIQASFLRAATPNELNFVDRKDLSGEAARVIRRIILGGSSARGEAALEFLMAIATKRLSLHKDHIHELLSVTEELPELERRMLEATKRAVT